MNIKRLLKLTLYFFAACLTALVVFYFWASSANHSKKAYSQIIENNYPWSSNNDSVYSIITYNIGYLSGMTNNLPVAKTKALFDDNLNRVYKEFKSLKADIICFQEIDYHSKRSYFINQQDELQKLGYNFIFQAVNWDVNYLPFPYFPLSAHYGEIFSGQSIFSKYPLNNNERIVLDRVENSPFYRNAFYLDRLAQVSTTTIDGNPVIIINVHFEAFDKPTRIKHANHIINIYNKYKDDFPVFLVGDFNSDMDYKNAAIQLILDIPGIRSAVNSKEKTYPSEAPSVRLDYIFYNEKFIELVSAKVIKSVGQSSDHLPVMMKFKIK